MSKTINLDSTLQAAAMATLNELCKDAMDQCFDEQVEKAKADLEKEMRATYAKTTVKMMHWFECRTLHDVLEIRINIKDLT